MFALAVGKCALYILGSDPAAVHSVLSHRSTCIDLQDVCMTRETTYLHYCYICSMKWRIGNAAGMVRWKWSEGSKQMKHTIRKLTPR